MINSHDIEQLSAYLDGQLNIPESKRLESRLTSNVELASVFADLRAARGILRKLPIRKAPRNFTLTRKMVGLKPPLPRAYPVFRFSTAFATILLAITFAVNSLVLGVSFNVVTSAGSGGGCEEPCSSEPAVQMPAPAATEAASAADAPLSELAPEPTVSADAVETAKQSGTDPETANQPPVKNEAAVPVLWQMVLLIVILLSGLLMWVMRTSALRKWR